jgi:hypothetical protein
MTDKGRSHVKRMGGGGGAGKPRLGGGGAGRGGMARFWTGGRAMVMLVIILGGIVTTGGLSYQSDQLYLQDRSNATASIPTNMIAGGTQAVVITATNSRGSPLINEVVKVLFQDKNGTKTKLYEGYTDSSGSVEPIIKAPDGLQTGSKGTLIVEAAGETMTKEVTITGTEAVQGSGGKLFISTDKPIYQPEQTVHIRTLGFEGQNPMASKKLVTVRVQDPKGNLIYKKDLQPNDYGVAAVDFPLSDQLPVGNYQISGTLGGIANANQSFLVKRYVLPKFKIDVNGTKSWYTADQTISGTVMVDYFFGKHVQGKVDVVAKVYRGTWDTVYNNKVMSLDENGRFPFSIPPVQYAAGLDLNQGNGYMELNVTITDTGGHSENQSYLITIAKSPISIVLLEDTNLAGTDSTYTAICRWPTGVPVQDATVTFMIGGNTYAYTTDERGLATVTFRYKGEKTMDVKVVKADNAVQETFMLATSEGIKVVPDKYYYKLGDEATFDVWYSGNSMTNWVYYDVISNGFTIRAGHFELKDGKGQFKMNVDRSMSPTARIRVYKIEKDMALARDSVAIAVESLSGLKVDVVPAKQTVRPGDDVTIGFDVSQDGTGVPSILGVSIVDLSVYELSDRLVGLDQVFWQLDQDYTEPTYQILDYVYKQDTYQLDYDHTQIIERRDCGGSPVVLESTWTQYLKDAAGAKDTNVSNFWSALFVLGFGGLFGLVVLGFKYKRIAVGLIVIMMVLTGITGFILYSIEQSNSNNTGDNGRNFDGQPMGGGLAPAKTGEGPGTAAPTVPGWALNGQTNKQANDATDGQGQGQGAASGSSKPTHVRNYFPETWYWNPTLITDANGKASITLTTPDSLTTWGVSALASTKDAKLGSGKANITVFQDFFVEPDVPVSAVRNDTFPLNILIYNYLQSDEDVVVTLGNADWYQLVDGTATKVVHVAANTVSNATFTIIASKVGWQEVSVQASAGSSGRTDAVVKPMLIEPDGKKAEGIFNGQLTDTSEANANIVLAPDRVPGSENAYVKLQASVEAVTVDGAENYISFVDGCGEQSMSRLDIDVLAFRAVSKTSVSTERMARYETMVTQGIQHEMTFVMNASNHNGRGIVWFPSDQDVHPWLTSWGLITFQDARNAGFTIDDKVIKDMQDWLVSQQDTDGSFKFPNWGLYEFTNPILMSKKVATTAYIMRALIYSGYDPNSPAVQKAKTYIEANIDKQMNDPYTIAIAQIGLEKANGDPQVQARISSKLNDLRVYDAKNGSAYWKSSNNMLSDGNDEGAKEDFMPKRFSYGDTRTIETTGYAIMAQIQAGQRTDAMEGIKYLVDARTGHGYYSTQDTVVAFQALAMAGDANVDNMNVSIYANGTLVDTAHFDKTNKDLTVITDLRPYLDTVGGTTDITLKSDGKGKLVYQVYSSEYMPWSEKDRSASKELELKVNYSTTHIKVDDMLTASLTMRYIGAAAMLKMVLVQLKAPVGFSFMEDSLQKLVDDGKISLYQLGPGEAMVYIQDIDQGKTISFEYQLLCNEPVKATIQGVHAFDMYNPQVGTELMPVDIVAMA